MKRGSALTGLAVVVAAAFLHVPTANAGITQYGELGITYEQTTTSFGTAPDREQQSSYQPCDTGLREGLLLLSGGGWIYDTDPMVTPFGLGQAGITGLKFLSQLPPQAPDSWHEIADNINNDSLNIGELTVCGNVPGLAYEHTHKTITKRDPGTFKAGCPAGTHVLGGGGVMKGRLGRPRLAGSWPDDGRDPDSIPDDGWRVSGFNGTRRPRDLHAYAVCAPLSGLHYDSASSTAGAGARTHAEFACDPGTHAIGGGFKLEDGPLKEARLVESRTTPPGSSWDVTIDNLSGDKSFALEGFCISHE